jgi:DNA replication protein DnaC
MDERFTHLARRVVVLAQEEARLLNHDSVGPEHILLGLLDVSEGTAARSLENLRISLNTVREQVKEIIGQGQEPSPGLIPFTPRAQKALELSVREARQLGHWRMGTEHLLLGLILEGEGVAAQVLVKLGADHDRVRQQVIQLTAGSLVLDPFGSNLTEAAREGMLDPVIGRGKEIERIIEVLSRRSKNIPILIGEPGVGKIALVEGLAEEIVRGEVPEMLKNKQIYTLDGRSLLADASEDRDIDARLRNALEEVCARGDIVFVDGLDALVGTRTAQDRVDTGSILKPMLSRGSLLVIGAMTIDEYRKYLERDPVLEGRFQPITVATPTVAHTVEILKGLRERYEAHHRVSITDAALFAAADLASRYVKDRLLPDSAIDLIDAAGARLRVRRVEPPQDLRELDERIAQLRVEKESAIDDQDFEKAASLRDDEKTLLFQRAERERQWKSGDTDVVAEVDEELIIEIVAGVSGVQGDKVRNSLPATAITRVSGRQTVIGDERTYILLGDQPVDDSNDDLLGTADVAERIASIISASRAASPLVIAIDGGWGVGKSTLLHQIESRLSGPGLVKVRFNAWTAQGEDALEGLIKSVLVELDRNLLRRWAGRLAKQQGLLVVVRLGLALVAWFHGVSSLVDELWSRLEVDAKSRNELRTFISGMLTDWAKSGGKRDPGRAMVVFIDDLDRCSDDVVVRVCEAVKLYLDAPGLIFVIGCDLSVLARGVSGSAHGGISEGRTYLEKIVQVSHRVPAPDSQSVRRLIDGYAQRSGTDLLIDDPVTDILAERTGRNPRRIKRVINSFVLEHHLDPAWNRPPLGSAQLITVILLQHLYPSFYDHLVSEGSNDDPIKEFLEYSEVRARASNPPPANDAWWSIVSRTFTTHGMPAPDRSAGHEDELRSELDRLERDSLPDDFPALARNAAFVALLSGVGNAQTRRALRSQLISRQLASEALSDEPA